MRSLLLLILCFSLSYAEQSKHCELSSDRCKLADFQPEADDRICGDGAARLLNPQLKTCVELWETCEKPPPGELAKFMCNKVTNNQIKAACEKWMKTEYCKTNYVAYFITIIGIFVGLFIILGIIDHFLT